MRSPEVRVIASPDDADQAWRAFADAGRAIYRAAFEPEQRLEESVIRETVLAAQRRLYLAIETPGATVVGFAVVLPLDGASVLLEYLAVDEDRRGRGIGARLFGEAYAAEQRRGASALYLEIDDPEEPGLEPASRRLRNRRAAFYSRQGVQVAQGEVRYRPPAFEGPGVAPRYVLLVRSDDPGLTFRSTAEVVAKIATLSYP